MAILAHYSNKNYFRFVYHDGSFESLDDRKKINYIDLVRKLAKKCGIQIIIIAIDSDIPIDENNKKYKFEKGEVILELTDESDEGRLFGFSF
ncbi:DUF2326 domain-containing protein [Maledivibacter halophilus]|uniref:DUF2326 domain-containing protein n=1 Tax=Maledivibacter halophilus TaxID=36842 RepID=UPI001482EFA9|nr:DUF2326 domain-containing protein [Maledivibacter halophilus]